MVWNCWSVGNRRRPRSACRASTVLSLAGMIFSGIVVILFVADLAAGFPFQRVSVATDIGFTLAGLLVGYLSWSISARVKT